MASLIEKEHLKIKEVENVIATCELSHQKIQSEQALMRGIENNLKTSPLKLEMASLKNYKPVEHGLMAAKNFTIAKRYGAKYEDIMKFLENGCINNFESDAVQMPLLTVNCPQGLPLTLQI